MPPKKKFKGTLRNRLVSEAEAASSVLLATSLLGSYLVGMWSWGRMSPQQAQLIAAHNNNDLKRLVQHNATRLGFDATQFEYFKDVGRIANLGSAGNMPNNCHRDFCRLFPNNPLSSMVSTQIPMKAFGGSGFEFWDQFMLWPHIVFSRLYHVYQKHWHKVIAPVGKIAAFWATQTDNPQMHCDEIRDRLDFSTNCVPLAFHGDGIAIAGSMRSWAKMLDVFSWMSLLGEGASTERCFYICSAFHHWISKVDDYNTYQYIAKKLKWSFECLWRGEWSFYDEDGVAYVEAFVSSCVPYSGFLQLAAERRQACNNSKHGPCAMT